jgi:SAM-dependent methyltransferase
VIGFTGERVIPGEVNDDLWAEHIARYAFAARFAKGNRVLDVGCGAGYGANELARQAITVIGIDLASDAVTYACSHYSDVHIVQASATALPFIHGSFHLVTAFEVIEHLTDWRRLLAEARRVLHRDGVFLVSTPNKLYYADSRAEHGPNPFHAHEFEFTEFCDALKEFFPSVTILLQNRLESFAFTGEKNLSLQARIDSNAWSPNDAHFFLAVCGSEELRQSENFVYVPRAVNLLRERERHVDMLQQSLDITRGELHKLMEFHTEQTLHLEQQNRWARQLDEDCKAGLDRITQLQDELKTEQAAALEAIAGYDRKVIELEDENRQKTEWALDTEARLSAELAARDAVLAETLALLDTAEATVIERTLWAQRLQLRLDQLEAQLQMVRESRWLKLSRMAGLGPRVEG